MPPHLVNYQAWLAAQGLTVQHGLVPENNVTDNALQAWNDSITQFDSSILTHSDILIQADPAIQLSDSASFESLNITLEINDQGVRFGLSAQGDEILSKLLNDPIQRLNLNAFIFQAVSPMLASLGLGERALA